MHGLRKRGVHFARSTAVFPSETRPNNATIGTGTQPGRHGITANHIRAPEVIRHGLLNTGDHHHLMAIATAADGPRRIVAPPTLGEMLTEAGRKVAFLSSGTPGQAMLQNPSPFAGWTVNPAFAAPSSLGGRLDRRFGGWPARVSGQAAGALDDHLERIAFEMVIPELDPQLLVLWSCEPDFTFHASGIGSPLAEAAVRANDARLGRVLEGLDRRKRLDSTVVFFISDHGQTGVRELVDLPTELLRGGVRRLARPSDVTPVADGVQLSGAAVDALPRLCAFLRGRDWCGPVFVRDDRWEPALAGTLPISVLWDGAPGRWVPDLQFSPAWDDEPNEHGVPGRTACVSAGSGRKKSVHGSLSPRDMRNTMILAGPGVGEGLVLDTPASTADVAPTVLHLLGLAAGGQMQGRVLGEALGASVPGVGFEVLLEERWGKLVRRRCGGAAYVEVE